MTVPNTLERCLLFSWLPLCNGVSAGVSVYYVCTGFFLSSIRFQFHFCRFCRATVKCFG